MNFKIISTSLTNLGWEAHNKDNDNHTAIEKLMKATQLDPQNAQAYNNLGIVYYNKGEHKQAILAIENALKLQPENKKFIKNLIAVLDRAGATCFKAGNYLGAISYFEKILKHDASKAPVCNALAICYYHREDIDNAIKYANQTIKIDSNHLVARFNLINLYLCKDDHNSALSAAIALMAIGYDNKNIDNLIANLLDQCSYYRDDNSKLITLYELFLQKNSTNISVWEYLISLYEYNASTDDSLRGKRVQACLTCYRNGIATDTMLLTLMVDVEHGETPDKDKIIEYYTAYQNRGKSLDITRILTLANIYFERKDYNTAAEHYEALKKVNDSYAAAQVAERLGRSYYHLEEYQKVTEALKYYSGDDYDARIMAIDSLYKTGDYATARDYCSHLCNRSPHEQPQLLSEGQQRNVHLLDGIIKVMLGRYSEAVDSLSTIRKITDSDDEFQRYYLAFTSEVLFRKDKTELLPGYKYPLDISLPSENLAGFLEVADRLIVLLGNKYFYDNPGISGRNSNTEAIFTAINPANAETGFGPSRVRPFNPNTNLNDLLKYNIGQLSMFVDKDDLDSDVVPYEHQDLILNTSDWGAAPDQTSFITYIGSVKLIPR